MGILKAKTITPLQAIRKYCLQCSCGDKKEVEECTISGCPLYVFRLGEQKCDNNENSQIITPGDMLDKPKNIIKEDKTSTETKIPDVIEPISKVDTVAGTLSGETVTVAETVKQIEVKAANESIMTVEETEKHTILVEPSQTVNSTGKIRGEDVLLAEQKPVKKTRAKKVKPEEVKECVDVKNEEKKDDKELDDIDLDDLFD